MVKVRETTPIFETPEEPRREGAGGRDWTWLMAAAGVAIVVWAVGLTLFIGELIPPIVLYGLLFLISIPLSLRGVKGARVYLLVISILGLLTTLLFSGPDLLHPESALGFIFGLVPAVGTGLGITAALGGMQRWSMISARRVGSAAVAILIGGIAVSLVAAASLTSDVAQPGDVVVRALEVEFRPTAISASPGTVGVLVDNEDPFRHTFAISELGVNVELPAGTARRVELQAEAGTYTYVCTVPGHEDMRGTLVVDG
ncbi:MAG: cupredoxin domain-containing protein [Acidimicrobiia bacterium]